MSKASPITGRSLNPYFSQMRPPFGSRLRHFAPDTAGQSEEAGYQQEQREDGQDCEVDQTRREDENGVGKLQDARQRD
jgi:hypothetical protein